MPTNRISKLKEIEAQKMDILGGATSTFVSRLAGQLKTLNKRLWRLGQGFEVSEKGKLTPSQANLTRSMLIARDLEEILLEAGYKDTVGDLLKSYDKVAALSQKGMRVSGLNSPFTQSNVRALVALKEMDFRRWETFSQELIDTTQKCIMDSVIQGSTVSDMADALSDILLGLGEKESLIESRARTLANTYGMAFDRAVTNMKAKESGVGTFVYIGPDDRITRPFCHALLTGKGDEEFGIPEVEGDPPIYTQEDIDGMDNGQDLDVRQFGGGYNCRHKFYPYSEEAGT